MAVDTETADGAPEHEPDVTARETTVSVRCLLDTDSSNQGRYLMSLREGCHVMRGGVMPPLEQLPLTSLIGAMANPGSRR